MPVTDNFVYAQPPPQDWIHHKKQQQQRLCYMSPYTE